MIIRKLQPIFSLLMLAVICSSVPAKKAEAIAIKGYNISGKALAGLGVAAALGVKYYFNQRARSARAEQIRRLDANNAVNIINCIEDHKGQYIDIAQGWAGSLNDDGKKVLNELLFKMCDQASNEGNLIQYLCGAGAEVDVQDEGNTPLMRAVDNGRLEIVRALVKQGAAPWKENRYRRSSINIVTKNIADAQDHNARAENEKILAFLLDATKSQHFWEKVTWGATGLFTGAVVGACAGVHWMWKHINRKYDLTVRKDWMPGLF